MTNSNLLFDKILNLEFLSKDELIYLYKNLDTSSLGILAHNIRLKIHPNKEVGWIIDRNINITNVCNSGCIFCSFHCSKKSKNAYITSFKEYEQKIIELFNLGGRQILLQGGMHPDLDIEYYENLFIELKNRFPQLKLHALGPPEIFYLAQKSNISIKSTLLRLIKAGLDSLPGAGAEILDNDIRRRLSPNKCSADEWLMVMSEAHKLNLPTSATMMFGHIETIDQRIEHLIKIRDLQNKKPKDSYGFLSFIPWAIQISNKRKPNELKNLKPINSNEYLKMIALSRISMPNIPNIQASLLTIGNHTAQLALYSGANDLGSIMMEENVVSSAGSGFRVDSMQMKTIIKNAGFNSFLRDQEFKKQINNN